MKFVRKGLKYYPKNFGSLSEKEKKQYFRHFTFKDPKAFYNTAVRQGWSDGNITLCNKVDGSIPFGCLKMYDDDYEIKRQKFDYIKNYKFSEHIRYYQAEALDEFFKVNFSIIKVPTGGGKTILAIEAIRIHLVTFGGSHRCMFLVDQKDLLEQSQKRFESTLGCKVGIYNTGKLRDYEKYDIILVTIQTLQSVFGRVAKKYRTVNRKRIYYTKQQIEASQKKIQLEKIFLNKMLSTIKFLQIDEVQEFGSETRANLIMDKFPNLNALLALSATPFRKSDPTAKKRIMGYTNGICYTIREQQLVDDGHLAERKVLMIHYEENRVEHFMKGVDIKKIRKQGQADDTPKDEIEYTEIPNYAQLYGNFVIKNKEREKITLLVIEALEKFGRNSLCLFSRNEHGKVISEKSGHPFISGASDMQTRENYKESLLKGKLKILFASNIFNKGVDMPEINFIVNLGGGLGEEITTQKKGRVLRKVPGNPLYDKAMLIDFYDDFEKIFVDHSEARLNSYRKEIDNKDNIKFVRYEGKEKKFVKKLLKEFKKWFDE